MVSEAECIDALREAADRIGESPTKAEYEALDITPASGTIIRQFGGWNAAKETANMETYQSTGSRTEPKPHDVEIPEDVSWEELTVDQRWHYKNRDHNTKRTLRRRASLRNWINSRKSTRGCAVCAENNPAVLDFHHRDPETKRLSISSMITFGHGKEQLKEEITKCEVLCANSHRKRHAQSPTSETVAWVTEQKRRGDGCSVCDTEDPVCLDFHHTDKKETTVAQLAIEERPREEIAAEIERCVLLCANCHRRRHYEPPTPERYDTHK